MAETAPPPTEEAEAPPKKSKKPLIIGLVLMLVLGGGGFFATFKGLILGHKEEKEEPEVVVGELPAIGFVPVTPLTITLGKEGGERHLRFSSQVEVGEAYVADVTKLLPRIEDVMNGYLRAVDPEVLGDPTALLRIKEQLLRRIQLVSGEGRVRDLLITEFIVN